MHLNFTSILHKHMDFLFLIANTVFSILRKNSNTIPGWMEIIWWEYRKQYSYSNVPTIKSMSCCCCYVTSVVSDSVRPQGQQPTRLRHPWDSPGKNTGVGCHFLLQCVKVKSESEVAQSCPTLHNPMDCSLPGFSVHGIFQARVLEWGAVAFSEIYVIESVYNFFFLSFWLIFFKLAIFSFLFHFLIANTIRLKQERNTFNIHNILEAVRRNCNTKMFVCCLTLWQSLLKFLLDAKLLQYWIYRIISQGNISVHFLLAESFSYFLLWKFSVTQMQRE